MIRAVVGSCWGDEGKGKVIDNLAASSDITMRYQGGSNAGHTIKNHYGKFVMHQLPSGVFYEHTTNIIGTGVALSIRNMDKEMKELIDRGVPKPKLLVSDRTQVLMPYHVTLDEYEEERLGAGSFGSTKSGIAPFYSDKYAKVGFQVCELFKEKSFKEKLKNVLEVKNVLMEHLYKKPLLNADAIFDEMMEQRELVAPYVANVYEFLQESMRQNKEILLEGQLGALKDPDHGIYPMVTSSSTLASFGAVSAGLPPYAIKDILVVVKAYSSAVGAGAFVSEIFGDDANELRTRGGDGGEFGATTGRPRRMGWFDVVATKYGCSLQGATQAVVTVLDVLSYLDEIPVCVAYEVNGKRTTEFPATPDLEKAKPIYEILPGFKTDIREIRKYSDLPDAARRYVEFIESAIGVPVTMVSNGPAREDIIIKD